MKFWSHSILAKQLVSTFNLTIFFNLARLLKVSVKLKLVRTSFMLEKKKQSCFNHISDCISLGHKVHFLLIITFLMLCYNYHYSCSTNHCMKHQPGAYGFLSTFTESYQPFKWMENDRLVWCIIHQCNLSRLFTQIQSYRIKRSKKNFD